MQAISAEYLLLNTAAQNVTMWMCVRRILILCIGIVPAMQTASFPFLFPQRHNLIHEQKEANGEEETVDHPLRQKWQGKKDDGVAREYDGRGGARLQGVRRRGKSWTHTLCSFLHIVNELTVRSCCKSRRKSCTWRKWLWSQITLFGLLYNICSRL